MKARQKNLRVFELEADSLADFEEFIEKNHPLLKDYLLVLKGSATQDAKEFLKRKALSFLDLNEHAHLALKDSSRKEQPQERNAEPQNAPAKESAHEPQSTLVIDKTIRSGEEIESENDALIFGRINSGARILGHKNVMIFGEIDGVVECEGEILIAKKVGAGNIIFRGELLNKELFDGLKLKKVSIKNESMVVEDL